MIKTNEANKKLALNAGLFVGTIVVGSLLGWGAWEIVNRPQKAASPAKVIAVETPVEIRTPAPARSAAIMPQQEFVAPAQMPSADAVRQMSTSDMAAQAQQMISAYQSRVQDPAMQQRLQAFSQQLQDPAVQQQLRDRIQQYTQGRGLGGGGQGGFGGGQGFGGQGAAAFNGAAAAPDTFDNNVDGG